MASDSTGRVKGVIVTVAGDASSKYHFTSRYFAPWNGIPEDPVTGKYLCLEQKDSTKV